MAEVDPQATHVGTVLDKTYRLVRTVGEGGMGTVYEALHLRLRKRVAIKLMSGLLTKDPAALARFRREADVTSGLGHPHIVSVSDYGLAPSGEPYLVMEYLDGEDLERRLRRVGPLEMQHAFRVVKQIASALSAAHVQGVVHRDLKPANIFLVNVAGEDDFVKVVDFGISKVQSDLTKLTQAHVVMGTPYYMSPEQAAGRSDEVDHRTDQWALACIAWEMLSGRCPFEGTSPTGVLHQVINAPPQPLLPLVPGLVPEVESVLTRALSKDPSDRFTNIRAFARALKSAALSGFPNEVTPTPRPRLLDTFETLEKYTPWSEKLAVADTQCEDSPFGSLNGQSSQMLTRVRHTFDRWKRTLAIAGATIALAVGIRLTWLLAKPKAAPSISPPTAVAPRAAIVRALPNPASAATPDPQRKPVPVAEAPPRARETAKRVTKTTATSRAPRNARAKTARRGLAPQSPERIPGADRRPRNLAGSR